jgi:hypothetical protein
VCLFRLASDIRAYLPIWRIQQFREYLDFSLTRNLLEGSFEEHLMIVVARILRFLRKTIKTILVGHCASFLWRSIFSLKFHSGL